jgi:hypothetical protein
MEILAHTLWTTAGVKVFNDSANNKKKKINFFWATFWGIFPDIVSLFLPIIFFGISLLNNTNTFESISASRIIVNAYPISHTLYLYTHSLIIWAFVFIFIWFLIRKPPLSMLGWALHIILDIPSHGVGYFATPFLFPLSEYRFPYGISWASTTFFILNYSILLIIWTIILFKKYKKKLN